MGRTSAQKDAFCMPSAKLLKSNNVIIHYLLRKVNIFLKKVRVFVFFVIQNIT